MAKMIPANAYAKPVAMVMQIKSSSDVMMFSYSIKLLSHSAPDLSSGNIHM